MSFEQLPEELQLYCLDYLSTTDLMRVAQVSKHMNRLSNDDTLWRTRFWIKYFPTAPTLSWRQCYANLQRLAIYAVFNDEKLLSYHLTLQGAIRKIARSIQKSPGCGLELISPTCHLRTRDLTAAQIEQAIPTYWAKVGDNYSIKYRKVLGNSDHLPFLHTLTIASFVLKS